jgi:hypothetical protein
MIEVRERLTWLEDLRRARVGYAREGLEHLGRKKEPSEAVGALSRRVMLKRPWIKFAAKYVAKNPNICFELWP